MTRRFEIRPLEGVGPLSFGMSQAEVRAQFGEVPEPGRRTAGANLHDLFVRSDFFAYYDNAGSLKAVEFGNGASVWLDGRELSNIDIVQARGLAGFVEQRDGFWSEARGISLWFPGTEEDAKAEAVLVHMPGYYD